MASCRRAVRRSVLSAVLLAAALAAAALAQPVRVLSSDLGFQFICEDKNTTTLEDEMQAFLRREGFKVLNVARIQREYGFPSLDLELIALDTKRRTVAIYSFPRPRDRFAVRLRTPPPTRRASALEEALLQFVANDLQCELRQITRDENGSDVADLYESELRGIENEFQEAERLEGKRSL